MSYRYFEMGEGDKDYWRILGPKVEFRTEQGEWEQSVLPLPMFLEEVADFGREITAEQVPGVDRKAG